MTDLSLKMLLLGEDRSLSKTVTGAGDTIEKTSKRTALLGKATALAMGGVAAAGAAAFSAAWSQNTNTAQLQAKLGLTPAESAQLAKTSGEVYAHNFGESLAEVNNAVATVKQGLAGMVEDADLGPLTEQALAFQQTFGVETTDSIRAVSQMLKTGLADSAQEAFDILTTGQQTGADKAGDLVDTFNEYGVQFKKLGIDGPAALGLINQGLQAGARDSDIVADSLKEFSIRAIDGSTTTAEGFKALGLDGALMGKNIARGGDFANEALAVTLDGLRAIKDPVKQSAAATALFGTQSEDLGAALYALDPATATAGKGMDKLKGSTAAMVTAAGATANPVDNLKRSLMGTASAFAGHLIPVLVPASNIIGKMGPAIIIGATAFGVITLAMKGAALAQGVLNVLSGRAVATTTLQTIALGAQRGATMAATAAQWLMNAAMSANPIGLVVIAIVALIAIFVLAYQKVGWFRAAVDGAFRAVKGAVTDAKLWVARELGGIVGFFTGMPGKISRAASGMFRGVSDAFREAVNWVIGGWNSLRFAISVHIPGTNKSIGGGELSFGVPTIPFLAKGGDIVRAGAVVVGDDGPELLNLPRGASVTPLRRRTASAGEGGDTYHIYVTQPLGTPDQIVRAILPPLQAAKARGVQVGLS